MSQSSSRGFTLIELMIVVAIIGVLSSAILSSTSDTRGKGSDVGVKSNLHTVQVQAEIYFLTHGNRYGTNASIESSCTATDNMFVDPKIVKAMAAVYEASGGGTITCNVAANGFAYAVSGYLTAGNYWCVDSRGAGRVIAAPLLSNATVCPAG